MIRTANVRCARTEIPVDPDVGPRNAALELTDRVGNLEPRKALTRSPA